MDRRIFLKQLALLSMIQTGLLYMPRKTLAYPGMEDDHFFVLIQVPGGWDVSLSLDPKVHVNGTTQEDIFIEYQESDIAYHNNKAFLAPGGQPLLKHKDDIHIIRGVEMRRDAGHTTNLEIMSSGYGDGLSAFYPVEIAAAVNQGPMGVIIENSIPTGRHNVIVTAVNSVRQSSGSISSMYMEDDDLFSGVQEALIAGASKSARIQEIYDDLTQQGMTEEKFATVAAAFMAGASYQASIVMSGQNLDTHSQHEGVHLNGQIEIWNQVSTLFDYFKNIEYAPGRSLFDQTTFLVVSEFARTPALNASAGKDHNPHANCALLAGRGVRGGYASGESFVIKKSVSESGIGEHISRPIDYNSGEIIMSAEEMNNREAHLIFPENISATIGSIFGNPEGYHEDKPASQVIPGVVKS